MPELVALRFGSNVIRVDLSSLDLAGVLAPATAPAGSGTEIVAQALASPIGAPPLEELAGEARTVAVLVSGRDRVTGAGEFMPPLLRILGRAGIPAERVTIFIATGTHIPFTDDDRPVVLGAGTDPSIEVVGHDCEDESKHVPLGTTSFGNHVTVNRRAYDCDLKILTGRITHHYFAGFTAGRKAVLPGVSGRAAIEFNHRLVLSGGNGNGRHEAARNGNLEGNPVHLDMVDALQMFGHTFTLNTVIGTDHRISHVFCGDTIAAHAAGCGLVADMFEVPIPTPAQLAVASCGGDPYDCSFMQALKTLMNTHQSVADGGVFVLVAQCPEGIKPEFGGWDPSLSLQQLAGIVRADYNLTGHNVYLLREICERIRVVLVSDCSPDEVTRLGLVPAPSCEAAIEHAADVLGDRHPSTYVIPFGNVTVVRS